MAGEDLIWLVFGIGVATGLMMLVPILYFLVRNRLHKDWVWAITRGHDGRFRTKELKPDGTHLHFKDWTAEIDPQYPSSFKKGVLQAPRSAWLYNKGDPRAVRFAESRVPELDDKGKPTGAMLVVTNPTPSNIPGEAWQTMLGTHITRDALGAGRAEILLIIAILMIVIATVAVLGLYAR